jgi:peroxiredoxin
VVALAVATTGAPTIATRPQRADIERHGTAPRATMQPMPSRADALAKLTVLDGDGRAIALGSLWADHVAILVFIRHFGCIHCRDHVVTLARNLDRLEATGARMIVIGNGSPSFIAGFRDETGWKGPLYTDPTLAAYRAAELQRGVLKTVDPRGLLGAARALASGRRQGRTQGDQWQQGGVVVVAPGDRVIWQHASERAGDNANTTEIVAALALASRHVEASPG